jgi:hypothetical protein
MFFHSKERVLKNGKSKFHPQIMCGGNIKWLLDITFHQILMNKFDV